MRLLFYLILFYILYKVTSFLMRGARRHNGGSTAQQPGQQATYPPRQREIEDAQFTEIKDEPKRTEQQ